MNAAATAVTARGSWLWPAVALAVAAGLFVGCADDDANSEAEVPEGIEQPDPDAQDPDDPDATDPVDGGDEGGSEGVVGTDLAILGSGDRDEVVAAVERHGGRIVVEVEETETYQARFPVDDLDALIEVRDALRSEGFDASLVATIDDPNEPGDETGEG